MGSLSAWHWLIVLAIIFLLFGRGRISALMGDVGKGIGSFRREVRDVAGSHRASHKASSVAGAIPAPVEAGGQPVGSKEGALPDRPPPSP